jgi:hypothetical protein
MIIESGGWQQWWLDHADATVTEMVPKVSDYSAYDLIWIGHQMAAVQGRVVDEEEATELGIYWYCLGKMGRWVGAIHEGRRPSDDTVHDLGVYSIMAERNRQVGGWPNAKA